MKNKINLIFLSYVIASSISTQAKDLAEDSWGDFEKSWKEIEEGFDQRFKEMQAQIKLVQDSTSKVLSGTSSPRMDVRLQDDEKAVVATINLGSGDWAKDKGPIEIEVKGNALDGKLQSGNYQVKFSIINGQVLSVSARHDQSKDGGDNKSSQYMQQVHSSYSQSVTLPSRVGNLEKTKAEFKDGKLVLELPKIENTSRVGWRKIEVK